MIIFKLISSGFKKNLDSECLNFYLGVSNKKKKYKIASSGGSFEPP